MDFLHNLPVHFIEGDPFVVMIYLQQFHLCVAAGTKEGVITKGNCDTITPSVHGKYKPVFGTVDGKVKLILLDVFSGINTIVADLFKVFFGDMPD